MAAIDSSIVTSDKVGAMDEGEFNAFFMQWLMSPAGEKVVNQIKSEANEQS